MIYVKINDNFYPAIISGKMNDKEWDGRPSKSIKLEMDYVDAIATWVEGAVWSIVSKDIITEMEMDEEGNPVYHEVEPVEEYDNSDYSVAGDIIDHRDGTITVKMGKLTELETVLEMLLM